MPPAPQLWFASRFVAPILAMVAAVQDAGGAAMVQLRCHFRG